MDHPLLRRLCQTVEPTADALLSAFLDYIGEKKIELYPAQEEAILALFDGQNVILNTPTGSGKSLVAAALHFLSIARGRRSIYTCPIKALVNEKFLALCKDFGPDNVGMITGDATVNRDAPILCCTAEILSNIALQQGDLAKVDDVIMDEFHYYSDRDRGVAWQVPLLTLSQSRFLLISATLGNLDFFARELTTLTGKPTAIVRSLERPVPLMFSYTDFPLEKTLEELVQNNQVPVYIVHFTQMEAAQSAQDFLSINFSSKEEKIALAQAIAGFKFTSPYGPEIAKLLRHGVGLHHAGLLPKYRVLVESLAQRGLLKIICGTDTLGVGVNVPIRTVLFTKLAKYDGHKTALLTARDFHQISGRAGRKGFDHIGYVIAMPPEHVVENLRLERKAAGDEKKLKKIVKKKPTEGSIGWSEETFQRLINSPAEPLVSRFKVSHSMLLNVLSRDSDGCRAMQRLIRASHETIANKRLLRDRAFQLFRALRDRQIIELLSKPSITGAKVRVNVDLQSDFSLNQTLSLYLLDTLKLLDPTHPDYTLDILTLAESIVEDPDIILRKQLDQIKTARMNEMKAEGIEFEERIAKLEELEYPKPKREFIYATFNEFAARHPWIGQENIRPKSIAREMFENFQSFADYIRDYELHRVEGILLRHLSGVYKVLVQTVPESSRTDALEEMIDYLHAMLKAVDSSLLEEWERLRDPNFQSDTINTTELKPILASLPPDITRNKTQFTAAVRTRIFTVVRALVSHDLESVLANLSNPLDENGNVWDVRRIEELLELYYLEHDRIRLDPAARNPANTHIQILDDRSAWLVEQALVDTEDEESDSWSLRFLVDLTRSKAQEAPDLQLLSFGLVGAVFDKDLPNEEVPSDDTK